MVNRNGRAVDLALTLEGERPSRGFRKYVYDPADPPANPFGDLQEPEGEIAMVRGRLEDRVGAGVLAVYTTAYDRGPPAPVGGLRAQAGGRLSWRAGTEPDLCYYRVYRSTERGFTPSVATQIGTTVATGFADAKAPAGERCHYAVVAVDQSGNAGRPGRCASP